MVLHVARAFIALATITFLTQVSCSGVIKIELKSFKNDQGVDSTGNCCSGPNTSGVCTESCKTSFRICLKHFEYNLTPDPPCIFGVYTTEVVGNNSFQISGNTDTLDNPKLFPFRFMWPGDFSIVLEAWHNPVQQGPPRLISRLATQKEYRVGEDKGWKEETHTTPNSTLRFRYQVTCDDHFYGAGCSDECRPRDDLYGHYTCTENGTRSCLEGWTGLYCDIAICLPGCHAEHGHCSRPNECSCKVGWEGRLCDQCVRYPNCEHGTCNAPFQCNCKEGWGGLFCNQDLNYCTHHKPCQNGATCQNTGEGSYTCICAEGFNGTNCEIVADSCQTQPCMHGGTCKNSGSTYTCDCPTGYRGLHCEMSAVGCENMPCQHGGTCDEVGNGYRCTCPPGWAGVNCQVERDECASNPCINGGKCVDRFNGYTCVCPSGYTGRRCQQDIDYCTGVKCFNGGTCIDGINNFRCQCVPGFYGPLCQDNVDECVARPCANGGTCHDLVNDFRCDCAPGFTGKFCTLRSKLCDSSPCKNGGTCTDLVGTYVCECPAGFLGKNCNMYPGMTTQNKPLTDTAPVGPVDDSTISVVTHLSGPTAKSAKDNTELSTEQLLLIACLGAGIPIVLIIIVLIIMLCRRRRYTSRDEEQKEVEDNETNSMNNKNKEAGLMQHAPSTNLSSILLQNDSNHFKTNNVDKSSNKQLIKDINTKVVLEKSENSDIAPRKVKVVDNDAISIDTVIDFSDYTNEVFTVEGKGQECATLQQQQHRDVHSSLTILYNCEKQQRHQYSEGMVATEV